MRTFRCECDICGESIGFGITAPEVVAGWFKVEYLDRNYDVCSKKCAVDLIGKISKLGLSKFVTCS